MISILQDDEGSTSEKMDFSLFLPCSSFLISTPLSRYACGFYCYLFFFSFIQFNPLCQSDVFLKSLFVMSFFCLSSARILRIFWEVELLFTRVLLRFVIFYTISCRKSLSLTIRGKKRWKGLGDWILQKHERREDLEPFEVIVLGQYLEDEIFVLCGSCVFPSVWIAQRWCNVPKVWMRFKSAISSWR